ncbi:hypothetical protein Tco_1214384 [Tanacetum coccineum]
MVRLQTPLPPSIDARIEAWRAAPTPSSPPPPLSSLSPLSSPLPSIPSPPLPSSPTHRDTIPEAGLPPQKRASVSPSPYRQDSHEMYVCHHDVQDDRVVLRALITYLKRKARYLHTRVATSDQENAYTRDAWCIAMDRIRTLQHQIQDDGDIVTMIIGCVRGLERTKELERHDGPPDTGIKNAAKEKRRNGNDNENGSHESRSGDERTLHTARVCTYKEFLNCQPLNFKGTKGAVGLAYWFEKMKYVFHISNCTIECQVKYATCTLLGGALTWWNSHVRSIGHDVA